MSAKYKHNLCLNIQEAFDKDQDLLDAFPELSTHDEFSAFKGKEGNKFIHYLFLAYDPGSAFVQKVRDIFSRKEHAAKDAGLNVNNDRVQLVMALMDKEFTAMLTRFFRSIVQNDEFEEYMSGRELLAQIYDNVRNPVEGDPSKTEAIYKLKIDNFEKAPNIRKRLKDLEDTLFGNDTLLKKSVIEQAAQTNMGFVEKMLLEQNG